MNKSVDPPSDAHERRSILKRALWLGGAALSTAVPSLSREADVSSPTFANPEQAATFASEVKSTKVIRGVADSASGADRFGQEFLTNKVFLELPLNFESPAPPQINGKAVQSGALVQSNGDILFRIYAPQAKDVALKFDLVRSGGIGLAKGDDGVFEGTLPYDDNHTGSMTVDVYVDGMVFIYPYIPIHWSGGSPRNFIEVPDVERPFLVVMNNDMLRYKETANGIVDDAFERILTQSCIPHIEQNYRVDGEKHGIGHLRVSPWDR